MGSIDTLNPEDAWILRRYYEDFVHAGAKLTAEKRERVKAINEELSSLQTLGQPIIHF